MLGQFAIFWGWYVLWEGLLDGQTPGKRWLGLRVVRDGGRFVFSCLTMDLPAAWDVFTTSAALELHERWAVVRNVTTSYELMERVATGAGWRVERWYRGDVELIPLLDHPDRQVALGQSICVLVAD